MSFAGYFFGNVDAQGRLESDLDDVNKSEKRFIIYILINKKK